MKQWNVGILGATGVVGRQMLKLLEERETPVGELRLLAGPRSEGERLRFRSGWLTAERTGEDSFAGLDAVLGAADENISRRYAPAIRDSGAVYIDNSSAFRLDPEVPLVVPEINGEDVLTHRGIIANPNCSTVITLMAIAGIHRLSPVERMTVCTYQAASGAGKEGIRELESQMIALTRGERAEHRVFPAQLAMNVIPHIGEEGPDGFTQEEKKLQNEGRRILHAPDLKVCCTCVRVPVLRSHSIAVTLQTREPVSPEQAREAVRLFPGCRLVEDRQGRNYPTPLDVTGQDLVWVGRIRRDPTDERGLCLWCCGDQIRKGAATNAVQILEQLIGA